MDRTPRNRQAEADNSPRPDQPGKPCQGSAFTAPRRASCEGAYEPESKAEARNPELGQAPRNGMRTSAAAKGFARTSAPSPARTLAQGLWPTKPAMSLGLHAYRNPRENAQTDDRNCCARGQANAR